MSYFSFKEKLSRIIQYSQRLNLTTLQLNGFALPNSVKEREDKNKENDN